MNEKVSQPGRSTNSRLGIESRQDFGLADRLDSNDENRWGRGFLKLLQRAEDTRLSLAEKLWLSPINEYAKPGNNLVAKSG